MDESGDSSDDESDDKTGDESNDDTPQGIICNSTLIHHVTNRPVGRISRKGVRYGHCRRK